MRKYKMNRKINKRIPKWLNTALFYEIYPQSFYDSNGDGIGDINGIIEKLDYICNIGFNALWINPWYDSPFNDAGYDVRDYKKIAPRYGCNADAERLFKEAHKRGMHILIDFVPGHTSVEHERFKKSCLPEKNEYTDRYIWTDSVWKDTKEAYCLKGISDRDGAVAINFFSSQPSLNYGSMNVTESWQMPPEHPSCLATQEAMKDVMRFWLDMGCDGFRVDMAGSLVKQDPDRKGTMKVWENIFKNFLDKKYPECALVSEWSCPTQSITCGFHMDFLLHFGNEAYNSLFRSENPFFSKKGNGDITKFTKIYQDFYDATSTEGLICFISGNHDIFRLSRRFDEDELKICFAFILTMPGAPYVYYGDEIGMKYTENLISFEGGYDRTGSRTPMQWNDGDNAGFSSSENTYLPINPCYVNINVESQQKKHDSLLNTIKDLIKLRKEYPAFGAFSEYKCLYAVKNEYPFIYSRKTDGQEIAVIVNPKNKKVKCKDLNLKGKVIYSLGEPAAIDGDDTVVYPQSVTLMLI